MPITPHTPVEALSEIVRDIEAAHGVGAPGLAREWPDLHASYEVAKAALEKAQDFAPVATPGPERAPLASYEVTIWYSDSTYYHATRKVLARSEEDAAAIMKRLSEAGHLQFSPNGSDQGPYGFEVTTPSSGTISWQED